MNHEGTKKTKKNNIITWRP